MEASLEYCKHFAADATLEIEDISNCALKLFSSTENTEHIIIVRTELGVTYVLTYGPIFVGVDDMFPSRVSCNYYKFDFSGNRIKKVIDGILNSPFSQIDQAFVVSREEALNDIKDFINIFRKETVY